MRENLHGNSLNLTNLLFSCDEEIEEEFSVLDFNPLQMESRLEKVANSTRSKCELCGCLITTYKAKRHLINFHKVCALTAN